MIFFETAQQPVSTSMWLMINRHDKSRCYDSLLSAFCSLHSAAYLYLIPFSFSPLSSLFSLLSSSKLSTLFTLLFSTLHDLRSMKFFLAAAGPTLPSSGHAICLRRVFNSIQSIYISFIFFLFRQKEAKTIAMLRLRSA